MLRFVTNLVIDLAIKAAVKLAVAAYRVAYGDDDISDFKPPQTTQQPFAKTSVQKEELPLVLFGEPLTAEEWRMIQNADRTYLN